MNAFFYPSKRGINFAKIRGFKFTDYTRKRSAAGGWSEAEVCAEELPLRGRPCMEDNAAASGSSCELANPAQVRQIASQTGVLFSAR